MAYNYLLKKSHEVRTLEGLQKCANTSLRHSAYLMHNTTSLFLWVINPHSCVVIHPTQLKYYSYVRLLLAKEPLI